MSKCKCDRTKKEVCAKCDGNFFTVNVEKSIPNLSYEIMEGGLKHLQGQVLTVLEATVPADKLVSAKSLVKNFFNDKLTMWFDWYGTQSELEMPNYEEEK